MCLYRRTLEILLALLVAAGLFGSIDALFAFGAKADSRSYSISSTTLPTARPLSTNS